MLVRHFRASLGIALVVAAGLASGQGGTGVLRTTDPVISPDGRTVVFSWQGDLFSVPVEGGMARRLTIHPAMEWFPVFTPDGSRLIFSSNRFGSYDLFSMRPDGTDVRRLTYQSATEYATSIDRDGFVYGYSNSWGRMDLFRVSATGGDLVRLTGHGLEMEYSPAVSPDGKEIAFVTGGSAGHWRKPGHSGSNTGEIWIGTTGVPVGALRQLTRNEHLDMFPVYIGAREIAVMSNRSGAQNVWRIETATGRARQVTRYVGGTIRALSASSDGSTLVYQRNSGIEVLNMATGAARPLVVHVPSDSRRLDEIEVTSSTGATTFAVSPNGRLMALEVRGDLFLAPATGGTTRRLTTNVRPDSAPLWLDDETVLYVAAGEKSRRSLWTIKVSGGRAAGAPSPFYAANGLDVASPRLSPDRSHVAFHRGDREVCVMPVSGGTPVVLATGDFAGGLTGAASFTWLPDSSGLAILRSGTRSEGLYIAKRDGSELRQVTRAGKAAAVPVVTADGRHFGFSAVEGLDFDEARRSTSAMYVVDLVPQPVRFSEDDLDKVGEAAEKKEASPVSVTVEWEGLGTRRRKIPADVSGYWPAPTGNEVYANVAGQLSVVNLATGASRPVAGVTGAASAVVFAAGRVYVSQRGAISIVAPNGTATPVRYEATARVNKREEEMALFDEAWWALDRFFYDPAMHGKSWSAIREEFASIVPHATSREDFYSLMGEMVERLDSSHQGATSSEMFRPEVSEQTAWFGVEWDWVAVSTGRWVVGSVYAGTPASHPESRLLPGDEVVSINGEKLGGSRTMAEKLRGQSARKVTLGVLRGGKDETVTIRPISQGAVGPTVYNEFVRWNRAKVAELSRGRLGYIHIEGMDAPSLDVFLREIATELEGKEGLIVDVRYNGGGFTSHIILNIMREEPWLLRTSRANPGISVSENIFRGNALEMPAVCLTNEYSFSNAEIFSEGFRRMKIGPVVGERTAGGVIGTGAYGLWDGGSIRMPGSGAYAVDGENLEGNGRRPDIDIPWDPVAWAAGRDTQLERAVQELMRRLPRRG